MRDFLFIVLVILLTPIYLMICIFKATIEFAFEITQPIVEGIQDFVENMIIFWKRIIEKKRGEK